MDELCRNNDISAVATEHGLSVKRSGNNYSCCCPFHAEKTPSCHLYTEDNHFHCFGCGAHGNVIKFVMQAENIDFMDAVEVLSNRVGMRIPRGNVQKKSGHNKSNNPRQNYKSGGINENSSQSANEISAGISDEIPPDIPQDIPPDNASQYSAQGQEEYSYYEDDEYLRKKRIYEMNREAGKFFHKQLFSPEGKAGLDYFIKRGLTIETIRRFGLGFAADDYHKLHYYMRSLGYSDAELKQAALISTRDGKNFYDKFRNRVMFPVFDEQMRVVAFGGRVMSDEKKAPKYLNSDETPVFQKRNMLFALNYAKKSKADYFIICEGYMDVIAMHQAGFDSAVASLGTAITPEQTKLLSKRGKSKVVLSYDSDAAGQKATSKAIGLFMQTIIEKISVLKISGAKDPDEFIKKYGAEPFRSLIDNSMGAVAFEMERLSSGLDMKNPDDKNVFIRRSVRFMADIEDSSFRELCIEKAAILGDISKAAVLDSVNELIARRKPYAKTEVPPQKEIEEPYDYEKIDSERFGRKSSSGAENAERVVLSYLYHNPDDVQKISETLPDGLVTDFGERIYGFLLKKIRETNGECEISWFSEEFAEEMDKINDIANDDFFAYSEEYFSEAAGKLNESKHKSQNIGSFAELNDYIQYKQKIGES